jgi:hypothetical protein
MKDSLDRYLQHHYIDVKKYTMYLLNRIKIRIEADTVISNAYLNCLKNESKFKYGNVKDFLFHFIKCELLFRDTNSKIEIVNSVENNMPIEEAEDELKDKILFELNYQLQKSVIEIYRNTVDDRIKLIFFETYHDKGYNTTRSIADHFNISVFTAHAMITEMKHDLRRLKHELKKDHYE